MTEEINDAPTSKEAIDTFSMRVCGLTDAQIMEKHIRLRGSSALKYPAAESACAERCGLGDRPDLKDPPHDHRCFLMPAHSGDHQFSSECGQSISEYLTGRRIDEKRPAFVIRDRSRR